MTDAEVTGASLDSLGVCAKTVAIQGTIDVDTNSGGGWRRDLPASAYVRTFASPAFWPFLSLLT